MLLCIQARSTSGRPHHTVPYGTELVIDQYQTLRAWLSLVSPSGTKNLNTARYEIDSTPAHPIEDEDDDEDDYD